MALLLGFNKAPYGRLMDELHSFSVDILHPSVLQLGDHLQPELRTLGLLDPEAQDFLEAVDGDADGQVHGLVDDVPLILDLDHQGIQVQDRIHGIKVHPTKAYLDSLRAKIFSQ